jgi:hypothetical protein
VVQADAPYIAPEAPPDPYRGPARTKADEEFEKNVARGIQAAFVGMGLDGIFTGVSFARGPHWRLSGEEKLILGTHVNNLILALLPEEYLGAYDGILKKFGPICGAVVPITAIIGKRIAIDDQLNALEGGVGGNPQQARAANAGDPNRANHHRPENVPHAAHAGGNGRADFDDGAEYRW